MLFPLPEDLRRGGKRNKPDSHKTIKKINNLKEKWPKAINREFPEEESEQPTNNRKRLNSMSNQGNAKQKSDAISYPSSLQIKV